MGLSSKRLLVSLPLLALLAGASVACADDPGALTDGTRRGGRGEETSTEATETPASEKKSDTSNAVPTPASPDASTSPTAPTSCEAAATRTECLTCCAEKSGPATGLEACACGPGAACQDACSANVCSGGAPDIACGICLAQSGCDLTLGGDTSGDRACLESCADKP
ncbi:MAG: hypothetical protein KIS78_16805 [Labilithrix sp.]|nr:hypothetical protein [Labilithrix sp.]MCW5834062.1 hypothetical protein [Labilithrix sp.]